MTAPAKPVQWTFDAELERRVIVYVHAATDAGQGRIIVDNDELKRASLKLEAIALRAAADVIEGRLARAPLARAAAEARLGGGAR